MSDIDDPKLESLLRSRVRPVPGADLAQRIVREARSIRQQRPTSLTQALEGWFAELRLPRPAVALSATLLVGLIAGWSATFDATEPELDPDATYVASFLYPDEDAS